MQVTRLFFFPSFCFFLVLPRAKVEPRSAAVCLYTYTIYARVWDGRKTAHVYSSIHLHGGAFLCRPFVLLLFVCDVSITNRRNYPELLSWKNCDKRKTKVRQSGVHAIPKKCCTCDILFAFVPCWRVPRYDVHCNCAFVLALHSSTMTLLLHESSLV